jgi:hypothetical protein
MKIDAEGGHNVDAGALTEGHHKPEPHPLDGAGEGLDAGKKVISDHELNRF